MLPIMKASSANILSTYSSDEPVDAWSSSEIDDCLSPLSSPAPSVISSLPFTYTSDLDIDLSHVWMPVSQGQQHQYQQEQRQRHQETDERQTVSLKTGPMGKKKVTKRTAEAQAPAPPAPVPVPVPAASNSTPPDMVLPVEDTVDEVVDVVDDVDGDRILRQDLPTRASSISSSPPPPPRKSSKPPSRPAPPHVNGVSSPALSALADDRYDDPGFDPGFDTRAWARNVPFGISPPKADPSPRDSPANQTPSVAGLGTSPSAPPFSLAASPPSLADRTRAPSGDDLRGGFGGTSPGISPRGVYRASSGRQPVDTNSLSVSPRGRPVSMQYPGSVTSQRPQAHFRGLSEAEIGMMPSRSASIKTELGSLVLFDQAYYDGHIGEVVLVFSGHALHIYRLDREKLTILGTLDGLRGSVLAARMIPPHGEKNFEPSIVLVVHGPAFTGAGDYSHGQHDPDAANRQYLSMNEAQTSVEVYGIKTSKHLATLYRTPSISVGPRASTTDVSTAIGALAVHVSGSFITITSGQSGEVYIFKTQTSGDELSFVSLGKTWTSMPPGRQRSYSVSSTSSVSTTSYDEPAGSHNAQEMGIVSLSHRWLAVVPPPASSQTSLQGEIGVPGKGSREPPGVMSHTSPAQPSTNCEADTPLDESFINKVARDAAQEAMKSARKASEAGYQAIKNYWNKSDTPPSGDPNAHAAAYGAQASSFPPTHAQDNLAKPSQSTTLVSIIDLERLADSHDNRPGMLVQPIATFPVRHGCSFLSFNPTGLSLFTSSGKGDVSYVWCLMRMIHGVVATPQGDVSQADNHATVRQIARFSRFTTSNIIDVVWTRPRGEKLAILTERGTVHIHDLPASAFRWPPPVRHASPSSTSRAGSDTSSQQGGARSRFGDAMSFVQGTAQSFSASRLRSSLSGATFSGLAATAGAKGGRMVAAGISRSMGAASGTMSNIRHMGENRISLPGGRRARVVPGTVVFLSGKYQDAIAITGDGAIKLHAIRLSTTDGGKGKRSVAGEQISQLATTKPEESGQVQDGTTARGQWFADTAAHTFKPGQMEAQALSFAEIETSTPYRTFHNDHRVTMKTFADDDKAGDISDDWVFGDDIETETVGGDQLPSGSMYIRKDHDGSKHAEETFAFEDEAAEPSSRIAAAAAAAAAATASSAASPASHQPGKQSQARAKKPKQDTMAELKYEDLIDMQEDIEASHSSELSSVPSRRARPAAIHDDDDEEEEGLALPFGENSEFGY